jgi:hypothetical protein
VLVLVILFVFALWMRAEIRLRELAKQCATREAVVVIYLQAMQGVLALSDERWSQSLAKTTETNYRQKVLSLTRLALVSVSSALSRQVGLATKEESGLDRSVPTSGEDA